MPDLQTLYDGVSKHVDLGMDYRAFHEAMRDSTRRRGFYDKVSPIVDIGDYETFNFKTQTYANESPRQVQPDQVGVTPPSPAEDSIPTTPDPDQVGDVWQRGLANMQRGFSDMFNLYDTWATKLEGALGITRGEETVLGVQRIGEDIFTDAEEWFRTKSDENIAEAAPATGIYAKPPENILGYLDPIKLLGRMFH